MGAGVDPHLYQPTESDIAAMNAAEMVVYSGLHLEGQFDTVFAALGEQGIATYALAQPVKDAGFIIGGFTLSDEFSDVDDPHFWFDPRNWEITVADLAATLAELDPANADAYQSNADNYIAQLQLLFEWANAGSALGRSRAALPGHVARCLSILWRRFWLEDERHSRTQH